MALKQELEDLLAQMKTSGATDEELKALRASMEKYPVLGEGYLRQSDYDRKMNDVKSERAKEQETLTAARERASNLQKWADENVPKHNNLLTEYKKLQEKNAELTEQVSKAAGGGSGGGGEGGGGAVDEAKLMENVKAEIARRGYVSKEEIPTLIAAERDKLREDFFKTTLPGSMEAINKMVDFNFSYRAEFGEAFDRKAFSKFVVDNKLEDWDKAYDMYVSEKRTNKKIETEVEKRVTAERSKMNLPGSGAAPAPAEMGHMESRLRGKGADGLPAEATVSVAAAKAAEELRQEGKF